jgi:hypothetical protein
MLDLVQMDWCVQGADIGLNAWTAGLDLGLRTSARGLAVASAERSRRAGANGRKACAPRGPEHGLLLL